MKYIRDPIYEYIEISDEEARLIDTPLLQRLRHISQNGPARLVYPSLLGTRFEHTLGVAHVASKMLESLLDESHYDDPAVIGDFLRLARSELDQCLGFGWHPRAGQDAIGNEVKNFLRKIIRHAAFFHDVGHICLSHTLETALQVILRNMGAQSLWMAPADLKTHELVGVELVRSMPNLPIDPLVKRGALLILLATGNAAVNSRWIGADGTETNLANSAFGTLRSILVGAFDADRTDYLERDGNLSASGFGAFDITRFIESLRLIQREGGDEANLKFQALPTVKALSALESTLIERYKLYKWVYFHHKVVLFGELAYRTGLELLEPYCRASLFEAQIQPEGIEALRNRIPRALIDAGQDIPPLLVLPANGQNGYRRMNKEFFFPADSIYLDDSWFSARLRARETPSRFISISRKALVLRSQVCAAIWKEYNGFISFTNEIPGEHNAPWRVRDRMIEAAIVQEWIRAPWRNLRRADAALDAWQGVFAQRFEGALAEMEIVRNLQLIPIGHCNNWNLIGSLNELEIIKRDGNVEGLMRSSPILRQLSGIPDDVPYFLFFIGEDEGILELKRMLRAPDRAIFANEVRLRLWNTFQQMLRDRDRQISGPMIESLLKPY